LASADEKQAARTAERKGGHTRNDSGAKSKIFPGEKQPKKLKMAGGDLEGELIPINIHLENSE